MSARKASDIFNASEWEERLAETAERSNELRSINVSALAKFNADTAILVQRQQFMMLERIEKTRAEFEVKRALLEQHMVNLNWKIRKIEKHIEDSALANVNRLLWAFGGAKGRIRRGHAIFPHGLSSNELGATPSNQPTDAPEVTE